MQQVIAVIAAATIGLFVGILIGKGAQEWKSQRAEKRRIRALESKQPRAIRMDSYKSSS